MQEDLVDAAFKVLDVCEFVSVVFRWRTCAEDGEVLHRSIDVKVGGGEDKQGVAGNTVTE